MNPRVSGVLLGILVVATFATGVIVYPHLPARVAGHWNAAGAATNTLPRFWGAFTLPIIMLVLWGLWALLPKIDPIAPGFKGFRYVYDFFWIILTAFLAYVYALILGKYFGWNANLYPDIAPGLAAIYIVAGARMPRIKRNWFFGIRTPWTLSSDGVWDKTHRFGSRLFILAGIVAFFGLLAPSAGVVIIITPAVLAALVSVIYSYVLYTREKGAPAAR